MPIYVSMRSKIESRVDASESHTTTHSISCTCIVYSVISATQNPTLPHAPNEGVFSETTLLYALSSQGLRRTPAQASPSPCRTPRVPLASSLPKTRTAASIVTPHESARTDQGQGARHRTESAEPERAHREPLASLDAQRDHRPDSARPHITHQEAGRSAGMKGMKVHCAKPVSSPRKEMGIGPTKTGRCSR